MLRIELDHAPNPDIDGGYWTGAPGDGRLLIAVENLAQASQKALEYIASNDLGGGNWTGGNVIDENGTVVARVSYNGRVWAPDGSEIDIAEGDAPDALAPHP